MKNLIYKLLTILVFFFVTINILLADNISLSQPNKVDAIQTKEISFEFRQAFNVGVEVNKDIIEDSDGFLWFSSYKGLVRYDGYGTKFFKAGPNSLSANFVSDLFEDSDGLIWIGTKGGGINCYDKKTLSTLPL